MGQKSRTLILCLALMISGCANHALVEAQSKYKFETTDEGFPWDARNLYLDLHLRSTPFDDAELERALPTLKKIKIRELGLEDALLTDKSVDLLLQLKGVRYLQISGTQISGIGIQTLACLPKLERLEVSEDALSADEARYLMRKYPRLIVSRRRFDGDFWRQVAE